MVMDRLGMFPGLVPFEEENILFGCQEISCVFCEQEPSLGEVKEAFDVFDRNCDGYIDAAELRRVLCALGIEEVSERECRRLITDSDEKNIDGRINFKEFMKFVEKSF